MSEHEIQYRLATPPHRSQNRGPHVPAPHQPENLLRELPRITRLMALAIRLDTLLSEVSGLNYRELARLGRVSRSRITQILNLLHLAPDLQERLLILEPDATGWIPIHEPDLRRLSQIVDWDEQRRQFETLLASKRSSRKGGPDWPSKH